MNSHALFSSSASQAQSLESSSSSSLKHSRVVVVCLSIHKKSKNGYFDYASLDAVAKIKRLITRIHVLCDKLSKSETNALWVMAWRENGITDADSSFVSTFTKTYLKEEFVKLTRHYPQLVIIGGLSSVKLVRDVGCHKKLMEVEDCYKVHQEFVDTNNNSILSEQWEKHFKQVTTLKNIKTTILEVMRNTVYIFQDGKVAKHDKKLPFDETFKKGNVSFNSFCIFQPAKEKNAGHVFDITHPITKKNFSIGVEICFEHNRGVLKDHAANFVDIHVVLSDSVYVDESFIHGKYFIHVDSRSDAFIRRSQSDIDKSLEVVLYQNDLLNEDDLGLQSMKCNI